MDTTMTLSQKQQNFAIMLAQLLLWIPTNAGYSVALGEVERSPEQQKLDVASGKSKTQNSAHLYNLAADLRLFKDGVYLKQSADYKVVGDKWKSMNPDNIWGGDWGWDGNHFQYTKIK